MSYRDTIRVQIYHRDGGRSILRRDDIHVLAGVNTAADFCPAEHLGEIWVERGIVKNMAPADRLKIFCKENMAFLSAEQNMRFSKRRKYQSRLYMLELYGEATTQSFLNDVFGLDHEQKPRTTVQQLLGQVKDE